MTEPWAKRLLPGSFRGIPFFIEGHEFEGGRNAVSHEPPDRDSSFAEDIGRKSNGYKMSVHLIGDDYFFLRDSLISAMEEKERGVLIHPYLGPVEVQPGPYRLIETTDEGRICRFDLSFIEAGDQSFPFSAIDKITKFVNAAFATVAQVQNAFSVAVAITGIPSSLIAAVDATVVKFIKTVRDGLKTIAANAEELSNLNKKLDELSAQWKTLIKEPEAMAFGVDSIIGSLKTVVAEPPDDSIIDTVSGKDQKLDIFKGLVSFQSDDEITLNEFDTPTKKAKKLFTKNFVDLVKQLSVTRLGEQAASKAYKSVDAALVKRVELTNLIDTILADDLIDDGTFGAFKDLKASIVEVIPNPTAKISTVTEIVRTVTVPALVVSYDLYGSLDNERDIVDRNKIRNPSFVDGRLVVLSGA